MLSSRRRAVAGPVEPHRRDGRDERGHDRDHRDLPAGHASDGDGTDHGDRAGDRARDGGSPGAPGRGTIAIDAGAAPANATAMTPRLASKTPSLLKPLVMPMSISPSSGRDRGQVRIAALLTVRRYGGTTASRIGSDYPDLCSAFPRFAPGLGRPARAAPRVTRRRCGWARPASPARRRHDDRRSSRRCTAARRSRRWCGPRRPVPGPRVRAGSARAGQPGWPSRAGRDRPDPELAHLQSGDPGRGRRAQVGEDGQRLAQQPFLRRVARASAAS